MANQVVSSGFTVSAWKANYGQKWEDFSVISGGGAAGSVAASAFDATGVAAAYDTIMINATVSSGGTINMYDNPGVSKGHASAGIAPAIYLSGFTMLPGAKMVVVRGANASCFDGSVSGGTLYFQNGGYGSNVDIYKGGQLQAYHQSNATIYQFDQDKNYKQRIYDLTVHSGGSAYFSNMNEVYNANVLSGGILSAYSTVAQASGTIISGLNVEKGGRGALAGGGVRVDMSKGNTAYNLALNFARVNVSNGAKVYDGMTSGGAGFYVYGGGYGSKFTIGKGGNVHVYGGNVENVKVMSGGNVAVMTYYNAVGSASNVVVSSGGKLKIGNITDKSTGGFVYGATLKSGAVLDFNNSNGGAYDVNAEAGAVISRTMTTGVVSGATVTLANYNFGLGGSQTNIAKGVISFAKDAYAENGVLHDYKQSSWMNFEVLSGLVVDGAELSGGKMTLYNGAMVTDLEYTGGSLVNSGTAVIEGIHMSGCTTDRIGNNAKLTIRGTAEKRALFEDNHKTGANAACINGGTGITIECADFLNNSSSNSGGCISDAWNTTTYLTIKDSYFYGNKAAQGGAALIYDDGKNASISGSTFTANSTSASGSVFYFAENTGLTTTPKNNSKMTVSGSLFDRNIGYDGAITVNMGTVSISDTVFTGNTATGGAGGGALRMFSAKCGKLTPPVYTAADVTISNAKFLNNIAVSDSADGGAIKAGAGSLTITGTLFEGNTAGNSAGAVMVFTETTAAGKVRASISGSTFSKNFSKQCSAIYNKDADLSIENTIFDANVASLYGAGAVYVTGTASTASIKDSVFSNNVAKSYGGAVRNDSSILSVSGSTFSANTSNNQAGAVYNSENASLTVSDSIFDANQALNYGGALRNSGAASVSGSTFSFNGGSFGGAIASNKQLEVSGSLFKSNKGISGGAMYNTGSATVSDSVFESNSASSYGAAIRNDGSGSVSVSGSIFNNNTAYHGGAIGNNKLLEVAGSTFTCNSASRGGAIYNIGNLTVKDSFFAGNISKLTATIGTGGGGAIFNTVSASAYIDGCTFVANSTTDNHVHASAVYSEGYLTIKDSNFIGNVAGGKTISSSGASGAVQVNGGTAAITGSLFEKNFAAWDGAALLGWGEYSVSDTRFNANTAHLGGAAFLSGAKDYFDHCEFTNNVALTDPDSKTANGVGGAAFLYTDVKATTTRNFTFTNSEFSGNSATSQGGALSQSVKGTAAASTAITVNTSLDISGSVFENNVAVTGSAVYVYINKNVSAAGSTAAVNGVVTANNAVFNANTAADTGSSTLYLGSTNGAGITANMTGATFTNNIAGEAAGIRNSGGTLAVTDGYFAGNRTTKYGAAAIYTTGVATVTASLFENNIGVSNGGAVRNDSGNLTIDGSVFSGNTAGTAGGAIYSNNKQLTVANSLFSGNASYQGGAVYNTTNGNAGISGSTFTGNFGTYGAAVAISSGTAGISGSTFTGNVALGSGAAIRTYDAKCVLTVENCVFDGNEALYGGAMYTFGTITVKDSSFLQASDTIANYGVMTIQGTNYFGGNFTGNGNGTVVLDGATVTFAGDIVNMKITKQGTGNLWIFENEIATDVLREFAADAITFKGETVRFTQQSAATPGPLDLTGIAISVDCTLPDANTTLVVASNVVNVDKASSFKLHGVDVDTDFTATVDGFKYQIGYDTVSQSITVNAVVKAAETAGSITEDPANKVADGYASKWTEDTAITKTTFAAGSNAEDNIYLNLDGVNSSKIILGGGDGRECASREGKNDIKLTAGTVSTIYGGGYNQDQKEVEIKLDGGTVTGDIFGGSRITDGGTHSVDTVVMTIDQNVASEGKSAYGAGFATKAGSVLNNTDTVIGIAGGNLGKSTAGEGVFGGGFADAGAQVNTENVAISLTGGTVGNIFGAGWAQQGGKVSVDNVNILVAGVEKGGVIYGGGAHSNTQGSAATTTVESVNISVTSANGFGSIYAGGQIDTNGGDSVKSATITVTGKDTLTNNFFGQGYLGTKTVAAGQSELLFSDFTGSVTSIIADFDSVKLSGDTAANLTGATLNGQKNGWVLDYTDRTASDKYAATFGNVSETSFELLVDDDLSGKESWNLFSAESDSFGSGWVLNVKYGSETLELAIGGKATFAGAEWELLDVEPVSNDVEPDTAYSKLVLSKVTK